MRPSRSARRLAVLAVSALTAGCAGAPFIEHGQAVVEKESHLLLSGTVTACFAREADRPQAEAMAADVCRSYGFDPLVQRVERYQCRLFVPHQVTVRCIDPAMTDGKGLYINPFDEAEVENWRKSPRGRAAEAARLKRPQGGAPAPAPSTPLESPPPAPRLTPVPAAPQPSVPQATAPQPAAPPAPPVPEQVPTPKPAPMSAPAPRLAPLPPLPPAPVTDPSSGFRLEQGGWGQAWDESDRR